MLRDTRYIMFGPGVSTIPSAVTVIPTAAAVEISTSILLHKYSLALLRSARARETTSRDEDVDIGFHHIVEVLEFRSLTSVAGVTSGAIVVLLGVSP